MSVQCVAPQSKPPKYRDTQVEYDRADFTSVFTAYIILSGGDASVSVRALWTILLIAKGLRAAAGGAAGGRRSAFFPSTCRADERSRARVCAFTSAEPGRRSLLRAPRATSDQSYVAEHLSRMSATEFIQ
jgi:hypothetical protein